MFVVSATPLTLLKLCVCFLHDMRMCMWFAYNCCINFCQFSPFIYRLCEHIPYNTIPVLCPLLKLMLHLCPPPPPPPPPPHPPPHSWEWSGGQVRHLCPRNYGCDETSVIHHDITSTIPVYQTDSDLIFLLC